MLPHSRRRRRGVEAAELALHDHPVEADPDLADRLKAAAQADRVSREVDELRQRMRGRSQSISRDFDRVLRILDSWGYVDGWSLTDVGEILARTFHECDLLIVECLRQGIFDDLEPAVLAGLVSVFVYEHRTAEPPPPPGSRRRCPSERWQKIVAISAELQEIEDEAGLGVHRAPDPTFIAVAYAWAAGEGFAEVVEAEELSGGDFVRTTKQLIDVLRQLALVAPDRDTRRCAEQASERLFRGVVAASSTVEVDTEPEVDPEVAQCLRLQLRSSPSRWSSRPNDHPPRRAMGRCRSRAGRHRSGAQRRRAGRSGDGQPDGGHGHPLGRAAGWRPDARCRRHG